MPSVSHSQEFLKKVHKKHSKEIKAAKRYQDAVNYLSVAQIYLKENVLLKRTLEPEDIKPRLLGHWGTCPGINLIYAHLNLLIKRIKELNMFLITGPGHGAPANLANLYLEGSLHHFYPEFTLDHCGLWKFVKAFSWPGGFPSHLYPGVPGTIHEGGELGYALATAFGAVMDNPSLVVACIVGDGEAETGPTAAAWHSYKYIDPAESGAVLPIVHINGYKIANPTIYGTMSNSELRDLFSGYGYECCIVEMPELDAGLYAAIDWAYQKICSIQDAARNGTRIARPKWPVILLRSLKGYTGVHEHEGKLIEGSHLSHQVPLKDARENQKSLQALEKWLLSYQPHALWDDNGRPIPEILDMCPVGERRMGMNPHTLGGRIAQKPNLPDVQSFAIQFRAGDLQRGEVKRGNAGSIRPYLSQFIKNNPDDFRIFCPDELESNKIAVFDVTKRNYQWPLQEHDTDIGPTDGRVLEILSEHTLQGWMQGYVLTGRYGLFSSYEAFFGIVATMMDQYAKFIKMSKEVSWRSPVPSLNYLSTSTHWRQEHNGFSHQNPSFLNTLLNKKGETVRIYLPPDANCLISTIDHCLKSRNYVNLVIATKVDMPQWLTMEEAIDHCRAGASLWKWASTDEGIDPDVVLVGIGDDVTLELMAAVDLLRHMLPALRVRVVNVTDLLVLEAESKHPHGMNQELFEILFTPDRPVIFNFHGYHSALYQVLFGRGKSDRFRINGYIEEGTTTTPFDMAIRNKASRFHVMQQAIRAAAPRNPKVAAHAIELLSFCEYRLRDHRKYINEYGIDPEDIRGWEWKG